MPPENRRCHVSCSWRSLLLRRLSPIAPSPLLRTSRFHPAPRCACASRVPANQLARAALAARFGASTNRAGRHAQQDRRPRPAARPPAGSHRQGDRPHGIWHGAVVRPRLAEQIGERLQPSERNGIEAGLQTVDCASHLVSRQRTSKGGLGHGGMLSESCRPVNAQCISAQKRQSGTLPRRRPRRDHRDKDNESPYVERCCHPGSSRTDFAWALRARPASEGTSNEKRNSPKFNPETDRIIRSISGRNIPQTPSGGYNTSEAQ